MSADQPREEILPPLKLSLSSSGIAEHHMDRSLTETPRFFRQETETEMNTLESAPLSKEAELEAVRSLCNLSVQQEVTYNTAFSTQLISFFLSLFCLVICV
jgi:hypothetical protein